MQFSEVEEDVPIKGNPRFEKRTNIEDLDGKLKVNEPRVLGLRTLKQAKIGPKRFDIDPPTKESIAFQKEMQEEVAKGR